MINPDKIKKSEAKHIIKLVRQMTKYTILARLGPFQSLKYTDYFMKSVEKNNELMKYLFDSDSLVELGLEWGLLEKRPDKKVNVKKKLLKKGKSKNE